MRAELPTPEEILEELADRVVSQIDRRATVAFDTALDELRSYHLFLLAITATKDDKGQPLSYAELSLGWRKQHEEWVRLYRRLYEAAASAMPDEEYFVGVLAHLPNSLLSRSENDTLSIAIIEAILDLGPMLVHQLERWFTKRNIGFELSGSDSRVYGAALRDMVGAWEGLLQYGSLSGKADQEDKESDDQKWSREARSWPVYFRHLENTAHSLAAAVWNGDELGAGLLCDSLLRWKRTFEYRAPPYFPRIRELTPNLTLLGWSEVAQVVAETEEFSAKPPESHEVFQLIANGSHRDVVVVCAEVFFLWSLNKGGRTPLAVSVARRLLAGTPSDDEEPYPESSLSYPSLVFDVLRDVALESHGSEKGYAENLDRLAARLDGLTERDVIPGRIYTPSTLHTRDGLGFVRTAILAASATKAGVRQVAVQLEGVLFRLSRGAIGDHSIRSIEREMEQQSTYLEESAPALHDAILLFNPEAKLEEVIALSLEMARLALSVIKSIRVSQLAERPVDQVRLDRIAREVKRQVLVSPRDFGRFGGVPVRLDSALTQTAREYRVTGIGKGSITLPPVDGGIHHLDESLHRTFVGGVTQEVWRDFWRLPRRTVTLRSSVEDRGFWNAVSRRLPDVGADPMLLISAQTDMRTRRMFLVGPSPLWLHVDQATIGDPPRRTARVNGVNVHPSGISAGKAFLFSSSLLELVDFKEDSFRVTFDESTQSLVLSFVMRTHWRPLSIFEFDVSDPESKASPT